MPWGHFFTKQWVAAMWSTISRMNTHVKPPAAARVKPTAAKAGHAADPASKPFFRYSHSKALRTRTLHVIEAIEHAEDATVHSKALADVSVELMRGAMDYFFMGPLKLAKVNFLIQQSASLGMTGTLQVMGTVSRNILGRMDTQQLVSVCGSIRRFML